jgi:DNA-binding MurR/RpiR family transcriptional regulator
MSTKLYESFRWMQKKYVVERLTEQEIAKLAGTTQATINRWLEKHGLKKKRV